MGIPFIPPVIGGRSCLSTSCACAIRSRTAGIPKGRNLPLAFGNENTSQRLRPECVTCFQVTHQGVEVLLEISLEHLNTDLINPSRAPIAFDVFERF